MISDFGKSGQKSTFPGKAIKFIEFVMCFFRSPQRNIIFLDYMHAIFLHPVRLNKNCAYWIIPGVFSHVHISDVYNANKQNA